MEQSLLYTMVTFKICQNQSNTQYQTLLCNLSNNPPLPLYPPSPFTPPPIYWILY